MWACFSHSLGRGAAYFDTPTTFVTSYAFSNTSGPSQMGVRGLLKEVTPTLTQNKVHLFNSIYDHFNPFRARLTPSHFSISPALFEPTMCSCLQVYNHEPVGPAFIVVSNLCQAGGFRLRYSRKLRRTYFILVLSHTASPLQSQNTSSH